jgi:hypothetical protein
VLASKRYGIVTEEYGPGWRLVTFDDGSTVRVRPSEFTVSTEDIPVADDESDDDVVEIDETEVPPSDETGVPTSDAGIAEGDVIYL